jgi:hypothetical protein
VIHADILNIYPVSRTSDTVLLIDKHGWFVRSRDDVFDTLDVIRTMYQDVILHLDPVE